MEIEVYKGLPSSPDGLGASATMQRTHCICITWNMLMYSQRKYGPHQVVSLLYSFRHICKGPLEMSLATHKEHHEYAEVGRWLTLSIMVFRLPRLTDSVLRRASRRALPSSSSLVSSNNSCMLPTVLGKLLCRQITFYGEHDEGI